MTEKELKQNGFKKIKSGGDYWYEFKFRRHLFITNDSTYNNGQDEWHIGYDNKKFSGEETFWFNSRLDEVKQFRAVFKLLTGVKFGWVYVSVKKK